MTQFLYIDQISGCEQRNDAAMAKKINPVREIDNEAVELVKKLVRETQYGALGVIEPVSNIPLVSRIGIGWSKELGVFFSASDLSVHSKCLLENTDCSIMLGEPGKGDGLAYPRVTLIGSAERMNNDEERRPEFRSAYLENHPKAELYIDFQDFGFYPLSINRALLNGGFGKAFHFEQDDLTFLKH